MLARITLKDSTMKDRFVQGLEENGFTSGYSGLATVDTYRVNGNDVYFNWKGASPTTQITFNAAGGTGGTGPTAMKYGATLAAPEVTKEGYTLIGWKKPLSSKIIVFPQTVPSANTTYIAQWSINSYTISFDTNGGIGIAMPIKQEYNSAVTLPDPMLIKFGYEFIGWNTTPEDETALVDYKVPAQDITLFAVYEKN
jgi:uncharacterized repeat protein (TIGR02543 family)